MTLIEFSTEVLHCVFCFCSQSDLASLSQANSTFQQAAEYLLYRHIHSSVYFNDDQVQSQKRQLRIHKLLFRTLASHPQKAALLRSLHVQLEIAHTSGIKLIGDNNSIMGQITKTLHNAHGLLDMRINVFGHAHTQCCNGMLNEAIRNCHFQLHTLYAYSIHDLEEIIVSQKHLRLLGIHYLGLQNPINHSELVNRLGHIGRIRVDRDGNRESPAIFMFRPETTKLILFHGLCLPGQAFTVCRDIATSLDRDLCNTKGYPARHCQFVIDIFDFTHANISTICEMVEAMAQHFSDCQEFTVHTSVMRETVSEPWRIPGFLASINRFKRLTHLVFCMAGNDALLPAMTDLRSFLLEELGPAYPTLIKFLFYNRSEEVYLHYLECSSSWEIAKNGLR